MASFMQPVASLLNGLASPIGGLSGNKYLAESTGAFILGFALNASLSGTTVGFMLIGLHYIYYDISGALFNPVLTVAALMSEKVAHVDFVTALVYVFVQFVSSLLGALIAYLCTLGGDPGEISHSPVISDFFNDAMGALVVEIIAAFALCLVYLELEANAKTRGTAFHRLAYAMALAFVYIAAAGITANHSGSVANPALAFATSVTFAMTDAGSFSDFWVGLFFPFIGAVFAVFYFVLTHLSEYPSGGGGGGGASSPPARPTKPNTAESEEEPLAV